MATPNLINNLPSYFEPDLITDIQASGRHLKVAEGDMLIDVGEYITHIPLLISGALKILREDDLGDELFLYFLEKGETCSVSMSCCVGNKKSDIRAIAEEPTELLLVPISKMEDWMQKFHSWRQFVLESYQNRLEELMEAVDSMAFLQMDQRIEKYLQQKAQLQNTHIIPITHQQIASDLHTSRVVVSRLLKKMEKTGKISLHRNQIHLN